MSRLRAFFDTNVLIYAFSNDYRSAHAIETLAGGGVVSAQGLNEFTSVARRKLKMTWPEVRDALAAIEYFCPSPAPLALSTHRLAFQIAEKHGFDIFDSSMLAAALEAGCDAFLSEDMHDGMLIDSRLHIVNPFPAS